MKEHIFLYSLIIITIFLYAVNSYLMAGVSVKGISLSEIQDQTDALKLQNSILKQKIDEAQALTTIEQKAKAAGFVPVTDYLIIK